MVVRMRHAQTIGLHRDKTDELPLTEAYSTETPKAPHEIPNDHLKHQPQTLRSSVKAM